MRTKIVADNYKRKHLLVADFIKCAEYNTLFDIKECFSVGMDNFDWAAVYEGTQNHLLCNEDGYMDELCFREVSSFEVTRSIHNDNAIIVLYLLGND